MKKLCVLLILVAMAAFGFTACGAKVNGDSAGKVSDTAQSTLLGDAESSSEKLPMEGESTSNPDDGSTGNGTEKRDDENLSQDLSKAITDVSDKLAGDATDAQ